MSSCRLPSDNQEISAYSIAPENSTKYSCALKALRVSSAEVVLMILEVFCKRRVLADFMTVN